MGLEKLQRYSRINIKQGHFKAAGDGRALGTYL
jgi:hypothetical protein